MPRVGLLSDSHGRAEMTGRAVELLIDQGATVLLHLGDVGTLEVIDELIAAGPNDAAPIEARVVFGNTDWDAADLARYAESVGVIVDHPVGKLDLPGERTLIFQHGHDAAAMRQALEEKPAWLCHGHTHERRDERVGPTRIINPGALFRASEHTVALLDTDRDELTFHVVGRRD